MAMLLSAVSVTRGGHHVLFPWWTTSPVHLSAPAARTAGRRNRTFRSAVTYPTAGGRSEWTGAPDGGIHQGGEDASMDDPQRVEVELARSGHRRARVTARRASWG